MKRKINKIIERLKICYYALVKKHYAFFAYDRNVYKKTGAKCYIESDAETNKIFIGALKAYADKLYNKINNK